MRKKYIIKYCFSDGSVSVEHTREIEVYDLNGVYAEIGHICCVIINDCGFVMKYINYELVEE